MKYDETALEDLKASIANVGQIYRVIVCKQHPDRILAGKHRKAAGAVNPPYEMDIDERAKTFGVSHEEMEQLIIIHSNVQRQVSREERAEELNAYAKILEGQIPDQEIPSRIATKTNFSIQYVLELLSDEKYKRPEKVRAGQASAQTKSVKLSLTEIPEPVRVDAKWLAERGIRQSTINPNLFITKFGRVMSRDELGPQYSQVSAEPELAKPTVEKEPATTIADEEVAETFARAVAEGVPTDVAKVAAEMSHKHLRTPTSYPSSTLSEHRKSTYTDPHVMLLNALVKRGLKCRSEVAFERPGETTKDGHPKSYQADIVVEDKVVIEVEGEGSSSKSDAKRDEFFKDKGLPVVHLSNGLVENYGEEVANLIMVLLKP